MDEKLIVEHYRSNQQLKRSVIVSSIVTSGLIIGLGIFAVLVIRDLMVLPFAVFALAIFVPIIVFSSVKLWQHDGVVRIWLSKETIGQEIPVIMGDEINFEVKICDISNLYKITSTNDAPTQWLIEMTDGRRFNMSEQYGNRPDRFFKELVILRPELSISDLNKLPM